MNMNMNINMNHDKLISVFNKQILEFFDQILMAFPALTQNNAIGKIKQTLHATIAITPHVLISLFYDKVVALYDTEISTRDDAFFMRKLDEEPNDDLEDNPEENSENIPEDKEQNNASSFNSLSNKPINDHTLGEGDAENDQDEDKNAMDSDDTEDGNDEDLDEFNEYNSGPDCDDELINIVKTVYKTASLENKKIIWDYIQRLRLLCIKYYKQ